MDYEEWNAKAVQAIESKIVPGNIFELKHLFPGHEWLTLSGNDRRNFGRYFSAAVKDGRIKNVERIENGKARQNQYVKKEN